MKLRYSMIGVVLLCFGAKAVIAASQFELLDRNTVLARLRSCPKNDVDRQAQLASYFGEVGCTGPALTFDAARHSKVANVICTLGVVRLRRLLSALPSLPPSGAPALWTTGAARRFCRRCIRRSPRFRGSTHSSLLVFGERSADCSDL